MLTAAQRSEFDERGYLHLQRAIPEEDVQSVLDRIWDDLEQRCGIPQEAPEHWPEARPKGFNTLTRSGAFAPTCSQAVRGAIDDFLGPDEWEMPNPWGALLHAASPNRSDRPRIVITERIRKIECDVVDAT